ncbi:MAG: hypothetical protein HQL53_09500 [Magnetococcales bacterium]|nr:hypothetical protein [Magnetococcales bacterium]
MRKKSMMMVLLSLMMLLMAGCQKSMPEMSKHIRMAPVKNPSAEIARSSLFGGYRENGSRGMDLNLSCLEDQRICGRFEFTRARCGGYLRYEGREGVQRVFDAIHTFGSCPKACKIWLHERMRTYEEVCDDVPMHKGYLSKINQDRYVYNPEIREMVQQDPPGDPHKRDYGLKEVFGFDAQSAKRYGAICGSIECQRKAIAGDYEDIPAAKPPIKGVRKIVNIPCHDRDVRLGKCVEVVCWSGQREQVDFHRITWKWRAVREKELNLDPDYYLENVAEDICP